MWPSPLPERRLRHEPDDTRRNTEAVDRLEYGATLHYCSLQMARETRTNRISVQTVPSSTMSGRHVSGLMWLVMLLKFGRFDPSVRPQRYEWDSCARCNSLSLPFAVQNAFDWEDAYFRRRVFHFVHIPQAARADTGLAGFGYGYHFNPSEGSKRLDFRQYPNVTSLHMRSAVLTFSRRKREDTCGVVKADLVYLERKPWPLTIEDPCGDGSPVSRSRCTELPYHHTYRVVCACKRYCSLVHTMPTKHTPCTPEDGLEALADAMHTHHRLDVACESESRHSSLTMTSPPSPLSTFPPSSNRAGRAPTVATTKPLLPLFLSTNPLRVLAVSS